NIDVPEFRPTLSADGSTLYFARAGAGAGLSAGWSLYRARRAPGAAGFDPPLEVHITHAGGMQASPACPFVDSSGQLVYFTEVGAGASPRIYVYALGGRDPPTPIPVLDGFEGMTLAFHAKEA